MGAMLRVLVSSTNGSKSEYGIEALEIDTVECHYFNEQPGDTPENGKLGKVVINTKSGNSISIDTGKKGSVTFIFVNLKFKSPYAFKGINGALILHTAGEAHLNDEKSFSQYVLSKGGFVPKKNAEGTKD